jgi:hypothetical protein
MKLLTCSLLTLAAFAADAPPPKPTPAPTPDPTILAEYFHARLLATQALAPCQGAAAEPNKAVQVAIEKLQADAKIKGAAIKELADQTVVYVVNTPAPEVKK